jgi:hypothetical protein
VAHQYGHGDRIPQRPPAPELSLRAEVEFERRRVEHTALLAKFADYETLKKERDEARAEAKELREILETAGQRLKACGYELTEFSYQELASVLLDLPSREGEP